MGIIPSEQIEAFNPFFSPKGYNRAIFFQSTIKGLILPVIDTKQTEI